MLSKKFINRQLLCHCWLAIRWLLSGIILTFQMHDCMAQTASPGGESVNSLLNEFQKIIPYKLGFSESILEQSNYPTIHIHPEDGWKNNLKQIQDALQLDYRIIGDQLILFARKKYLIQGFVYDQQTGESLPGAHVLLSNYQIGTTSNDAGYYQMLIPEGAAKLSVSYIGYETKSVEFEVSSPTKMDFELAGAVNLPEVVVQAENISPNAPPFYQSTEQNLPLKTLHTLPSVGSFMDLMRYLQLNAGVISGGDGLGGLHVRGGNADQNLILLEDIPIYNPYHLFGVSSIFNTYAVQEASFDKSSFESAYDGRLSSVLKVTIRDGHRTKKRLDASTGLLDTHLLLESPIGNQKGTFMLAGQLSHAGGLIKSYTRQVRSYYDNDGYLKPKFQDLYAKSMIDINRANKLVFNGYIGSNSHLDINRYPYQGGLDTTYLDQYQDEFYWGNTAAGIKWLHEINGHAFLKINAYHSGYRYHSINAYSEEVRTNKQDSAGYFEISEFRSSIRESGIKADLEWLINLKHSIKMGGSGIVHQYVPGVIAYGEDASQNPMFNIGSSLPALSDTLFDALSFSSQQISLYGEDTWELNHKWSLRYGMSSLLFVHTADRFFSVQPRILLDRKTKAGIISFSINKLYQPQHLLTATDNGLPNELWVPPTQQIPPQVSWQADLSWRHAFSDNTLVKSSIYYKRMLGLLTFVDEPGYLTYGPLDNVDASIWEDDVLIGDGESWGIETIVQQHWKHLHLQANYTFSKSNRYFDGKNLSYIVPYAFEAPHVVNILGMWAINERWQVALSWQLSSGTSAILTPGNYEVYDGHEEFVEEFVIDNHDIQLLILPVYHRLDLSATWTLKSSEKLNHQLKLSLLNAYNQQNIILPRIYRDPDYSIIRYTEGLPLMPSISYHLTLQ